MLNERTPGIHRTALVYTLMILLAVWALIVVCRYGETLQAPQITGAQPAASDAIGPAGPGVLLRVLFALSAVIVTGLILSKLFALIGQPPVIGEVIAGIVLGPSLIGPDISRFILPAEIAPTLGIIAQLGVVLFMFMVGLELRLDRIRNRVHSAVALSHASILVPFLLGALLALYLYPLMSNRDVRFTSFALFIGVAMSITAFPVLARILRDRGMTQTDLGVVALSCAAMNDVTAWCLLAFILSAAGAELAEALKVALGALAFIAAMVLVVRPVLRRMIDPWEARESLSRTGTAVIFIAMLLSAVTTESIGIHAIFGAFLFGAVIPHDSVVARTFTRQLDSIVTVLLLPAFFAFTGMRTRIDLVTGFDQWMLCGLIILVATAGKLGGTAVAARLTGMSWRTSAALGALMNTRGLMELIVLNIGLDLNVISPPLFAMMVLMALATTLMTAPLLRLLLGEGG